MLGMSGVYQMSRSSNWVSWLGKGLVYSGNSKRNAPWFPSIFAEQALLHPTGKPVESNGPINADGPEIMRLTHIA